MKIRFVRAIGLLTCALWMLTGCEERSISDSGYHGNGYGRGPYSSYGCRGELLEADEGGEDTALSAGVERGSSDQKQVAKLMAAAYASLGE